jgi:hypothetical protein
MRKTKIGSGHWHEVLDRTYLLVDVVETHLLENDAVQSLSPRDQLRRKIDQAVGLLAEAYQLAGGKFYDAVEAEEAESNARRKPRGQKRPKKKTR